MKYDLGGGTLCFFFVVVYCCIVDVMPSADYDYFGHGRHVYLPKGLIVTPKKTEMIDLRVLPPLFFMSTLIFLFTLETAYFTSKQNGETLCININI